MSSALEFGAAVSSRALWCLGIVVNTHVPSRNQSSEAVSYTQTEEAGSIVVASMHRVYLYAGMCCSPLYTGIRHHLHEHDSRSRLTLRIQLSRFLARKKRERNGRDGL